MVIREVLDHNHGRSWDQNDDRAQNTMVCEVCWKILKF